MAGRSQKALAIEAGLEVGKTRLADAVIAQLRELKAEASRYVPVDNDGSYWKQGRIEAYDDAIKTVRRVLRKAGAAPKRRNPHKYDGTETCTKCGKQRGPFDQTPRNSGCRGGL